MAENENDNPNPNPGGGGAVDPSEGDGPNASVQAQEGGAADEKDKNPKKDEPRTASKGINPVQHSE